LVRNKPAKGVRVQVEYDTAKKEQVTLEDEPAAILERNPQLKNRSIQGGLLFMPLG
jgi:hypothetical protein